MKPNVFVTFCVMCLLAASCTTRDVYNPDRQEGDKTTDLTVPQDFDWSATRVFTGAFNAPVACAVEIHTAEECTENSLLATLALEGKQTKEFQIELPASSQTFYVKYPVKEGSKVMEVAVPATTDTRALQQVGIQLPEEVKKDEASLGQWYSESGSPGISTGKKGTLMFEDLYPSLGDYDFNDFVAQYHTYVKYRLAAAVSEIFDGYIQISINVQAIGGSLPYKLAVELPYVPGAGIKDITNNSDNGLAFELLNEDDAEHPAVLQLSGTESLTSGGFFNTDPEKEMQDMPSLTCIIHLKDNLGGLIFGESALHDCYANHASAFNFFLRDNAGKEIHLKGYKPSSLCSTPDAEYHSADNFVWGMKVPAVIPHPTEQTDITDAYPQFEDWVTSGGQQNRTWYTKPASGLILEP